MLPEKKKEIVELIMTLSGVQDYKYNPNQYSLVANKLDEYLDLYKEELKKELDKISWAEYEIEHIKKVIDKVK
jgi:hypothetical protein